MAKVQAQTYGRAEQRRRAAKVRAKARTLLRRAQRASKEVIQNMDDMDMDDAAFEAQIDVAAERWTDYIDHLHRAN